MTLLTLVARAAIGKSFESPTLIVFTVPILLSAYWGGLGPGLLATLLSVLGADYFLLEPLYSFRIFSINNWVQESVLLLTGGLISLICELFHRAHHRVEDLLAERRQGEDKMAQLAAIVQTSDDAIIGKNLEGIITSWNAGAEKIFGYPADEMVGQPILRLIPPERHQEETKILSSIKRGESVRHLDTVRVRKDGSLVDVSITTSAIRDKAGHIVGASKIARDITERKAAERALRQSEARLNFALQASHTGAWDLSLADKTAHRTLIHARIFGYDSLQSEWTYGMFLDHVVPEDRAKVDEIFRAAGATFGEWNFECRIHRADGATRWIWAAGGHELNSAGKAERMSGIVQDITERKQAEEARLTSESRYRALFEYAPDGIVIADSKSYYLDANASVCRMLGYTREEMVGKHASEIVVPDEIQNIEPALSAIKSHSNYSREWRFRRKDGSVFDTEVIAAAMPDGKLMGIIRDITERKRIEKELGWKTAFLEAQVNSSPDGILVVDNQDRRIQQNLQLIGLFHVPKEIADDIDDAPLLRHVTRQMKNPEQFLERVKYLNAHPDEIGHDEIEMAGGKILDRYSSPVLDKAGNYYGRIWAFRDVTERNHAEEALRESEKKFRQLAENISEVFWVTNSSMHDVLYVSPAYEKIWGRTCESLYASPRQWLEVIHPADQERVLKAAADFAVSGIYDVEFRIIRPDQSVRWVHDRGFPVRDTRGEVYRIVGTAEDISQRKKLEEQFRQSQKMEGIGQLAGGVAHDFNNILAVIQMDTDLLRADGNFSETQLEYVNDIEAAAQRAVALTRQLLLFSRKQALNPCRLNLNESINDVTKMLVRTIGENIQFQFKFSTQPLFIHADAGMMDQVLINLAVNARDAMPDGGQLVIETSAVEFDESIRAQSEQARAGSFVCLSVTDSGCGIPPENITKIFEPFFTTKDVGKGTGLGLATVFGIVQQHQGWINVYSEVNHGTTFRVYLPRQPKEDGEKSTQPILTAAPRGNETILLAEDDPALRASVRLALSRLGYRVIEAPTGLKALEIWRQNRDTIHLLLTDLVMPDHMTGKDLAQHILQENPKLKVVYMSGYSAEVVGKDFPFREGVNFLNKPFPASKLAQIVRDSLDLRD